MPKAEVGSTKWLGNKMKAKGLQRLRWYCQVCERQMRDANGFKQHTLSESHVRQMQAIGTNANRTINAFSEQFKNDFLQLLRTSHGEKRINLNHFYQELIADKTHIHLNATKWPTLTEFAKHLGREGVCRIDEGERGIEVSWIDNSPEALRRQAAVKKKERQDRGDEEREQKLIQEQVERARRDADSRGNLDQEMHPAVLSHRPQNEGKKISLRIDSAKPVSPLPTNSSEEYDASCTITEEATHLEQKERLHEYTDEAKSSLPEKSSTALVVQSAISIKPKNVFAIAAKKSAFAEDKLSAKRSQQRPMTEAERIMREELSKKHKMSHVEKLQGSVKRQRL